MKIGIIREGKVPPDRRVALLPEQCKEIVNRYPQIQIFVQPSPIRCVSDTVYAAEGFTVTEDLSHCDVLLGIKEVPIPQLISGKIYFFFSHTVKKQKYNRRLLQTILQKNITLIDYECLTNGQQRIIAFGRYAGIVGAYNGMWTFGRKYKLFDLKRACACNNMAEMRREYGKITLPPIKIAVTGSGRVAKGVLEVLDDMHIRQVAPPDFLEADFDEPVYTVLRSQDYHQHKQGLAWDAREFHKNPGHYHSLFAPFAKAADMLIASAFWNPQAPVLFSKNDMQQQDFRIRVIADISCDVDGSIPCTIRTTTITDPVFDYNPDTQQEEPAFSHPDNITVMAIDNLPCELPYDASAYFGSQFITEVLPHLLNGDSENILERATITRNGHLTQNFAYLTDFVAEDAEN